MTSFPSLRTVLAVALVCGLLGAAACGGTEPSRGDGAGPADTEPDAHGAGMGVRDGSVAEVRALGTGPEPGETWSVPVALNVCGRFLDPVPGGPREVAGTTIEATPSGRLEIRAGDVVEGTPLVADWADAAGFSLSTGTLTLPGDVRPSVLDSTDPVTPLAGATLGDDTTCGGTPASVQVWVYPAGAVESGSGILVVREDPELVPFAQEGMAVVVALSPESSLPTLPPSALVGS